MRSETNSNSGFTLIEILVSTVLFVLVSGSIIGTYTYIMRINQRSQAIRTASDNARYLLEYLTREVRNGKILYDSRPSMCGSGAIPMPSLYLPIVNVEGEKECFYVGGTNGASVDANGTNLWVQKTVGSVTYPPVLVNSQGIQIQKLKFLITPSTDPYAGVGVARQESVTITGLILSGTTPRDTVNIPFQTSISLPLYDM